MTGGREVLTTQGLLEEAGEDASWTEDPAGAERVLARGRAMVRILEGLPSGFRVERVQGRKTKGSDPGAEYALIDATFRPERLIARVDRRLIGRQYLTWTKLRMGSIEQAEAMACVLRLAAADAESRR